MTLPRGELTLIVTEYLISSSEVLKTPILSPRDTNDRSLLGMLATARNELPVPRASLKSAGRRSLSVSSSTMPSSASSPDAFEPVSSSSLAQNERSGSHRSAVTIKCLSSSCVHDNQIDQV